MLNKIQTWIDLEATILKKEIDSSQNKINGFESQYGNVDRDTLYGKVDDMDILEWEGEIETMNLLQEKLNRLDQIVFENR